jgi:catechol 2,3-dioxygenase-like lactoylglutathione lyase family enzyme
MELRLEVVILPVADVDRAKAFYTETLGFDLDVDQRAGDDFRVVQMTPPGSACSVTVGVGLTDAAPGTVRGTHLVTPDIQDTRNELAARGLPISPVRHLEDGKWVEGRDPAGADYASFADFADPDGNTWVLQEVRKRPAPA